MSKALPIKKIFIKRMIISTIMQFFILAVMFISIKNYFISNEKENLVNNLTINDSFSQEELTKYRMLENDYAFDLSLRGIADERKLDSIWFSDKLKPSLGKCSAISNSQYLLCDGKNGVYYGVTPLSFNHKIIGYVIASKKYGFFSAPIYYGLIIILIVVMGAFLFNFLFLFLSIKNSFEKNTQKLLNFITSQNNNEPCSEINIQEYSQVAQRFIEKRSEIRLLEKEKSYSEAMKNLAVQVAHDIRSPLLLLKTVLSDLSSLPERNRIDAYNAIQRVTDIANNLLVQYRQDAQSLVSTVIECASEPVAIMLESIVSEKRIQLTNANIKINLIFSPNMYDAFVCVDIIEFKRVLSNLMNNAIEACKGEPGIIMLLLGRNNDNKVIIDVKDNGCGISDERLNALLKEGGSFDKKEGSGLGLPYAMNKIIEWNGDYSFTSKLGEGTQFEMILPEVKPAEWFCSHIDLLRKSTIVVLDDDEYIHQIWNERFSESFLLRNELTLLHFTNPKELILFCKKHTIENTAFFLDYELGKKQLTGLEVARKLGIGNHATLVTSRYEDDEARKNCQNLGMKIIPKFFAEHVPINIYVGISAEQI